MRVPTTFTSAGFTLGIPAPGEGFSVFTDVALRPGEQAHAHAQLVQPGNVVIDSGTVTGEWQPTTQILNQPKATTGGGGLTAEQSLQLSQTHESTFIDKLIDTVTLVPLTTGPSPGPINSQLPDTIFGVIVRIANVPEDLVPNTPDGDYWYPSLAVCRIYRGSDLWKRIPVHTSSKLIGLLDESIVAGVAAITATLWLLNMSIQVSFRPGVTGEVFLMRFP